MQIYKTNIDKTWKPGLLNHKYIESTFINLTKTIN